MSKATFRFLFWKPLYCAAVREKIVTKHTVTVSFLCAYMSTMAAEKNGVFHW